MQFPYVLALMLSSMTSCCYAAPFNNGQYPVPKYACRIRLMASESLNGDLVPRFKVIGDIKTCVEEWQKDKSAVALEECIQTVLHDKALVF